MLRGLNLFCPFVLTTLVSFSFFAFVFQKSLLFFHIFFVQLCLGLELGSTNDCFLRKLTRVFQQFSLRPNHLEEAVQFSFQPFCLYFQLQISWCPQAHIAWMSLGIAGWTVQRKLTNHLSWAPKHLQCGFVQVCYFSFVIYYDDGVPWCSRDRAESCLALFDKVLCLLVVL